MKQINCPYLGLKDDPTTAMGFPSPGNYCHQGRPIAPVKGAYQEKYCLTAEHTACPIYQATHPVPLPAAIAAKPGPILNGRQVLALLGIPAMIVAAAALFYAWNTFGSQLSLFRQIPNTGPSMGDNNFQLLGGDRSVPTLTPFSPLVAGSSAKTPTATCPWPENWVPYTVNPTDSLFRLSVIYGVSIEQLQKANCMGNQTVILPGQTIYIPFVPTDTPLIPDTPVPQAPLPANPQPQAPPVASATATSAPESPRRPTRTPTAIPPTSTTLPSATGQPSDTPEPPTSTAAATATATAAATAAPPPSPTETATEPSPPEPTATSSPLPPVDTATNTPIPSNTEFPTAIPTSATATELPTTIPTSAATELPTAAPTSTTATTTAAP